MPHYQITKYYYHYYVLACLFFLSIGTAIYIFKGNFSPTLTVKFVALVIASFFYVLLMLYFLNLKMNQEWLIPRQWRRVQMQPKLHVLVIFPLLIIPLLWLNLAGTFPMIWKYGRTTSNRGSISHCRKKTLPKYRFLFFPHSLCRNSYF